MRYRTSCGRSLGGWDMASNWPELRLGDISSLQRGVAYSAEQLGPPGRPFVTIKCFEKGGGFRSDGVKMYSGATAGDMELHGGELLLANTDLTRDGSIVGAAALVPPFEGVAATYSMDVSHVATDPSRADNQFLAYRLAAHDARL